MLAKTICSLCTVLILVSVVGCNPRFKEVSMEHENHREMITADLNKLYGVVVKPDQSVPPSASIPVEALSAYCIRDGGRFDQLQPDKDVVHASMMNITGIFDCRSQTDLLWRVGINVERGKAINGAQGYYVSVKDRPL